MLKDILSIGSKIAALVIFIGLVIGLMAIIPVPAINLQPAYDFMNKVYTIFTHYFPLFPTLWNLGVALIYITITYFGIKVSMFGIRIVMRLFD